MTLSVCALLYGDYPDLARRCLTTLVSPGFFQSGVVDVRIGLNSVSNETERFVTDWAWALSRQTTVPVTLFAPTGNIFKYPTMRRMFCHAPLGEYVMWLDDDTYISDSELFWSELVAALRQQPDMLGQAWLRRMSPNQWRWILKQPWANERLARRTDFAFFTGGFWVIRSSVLLQLDWPWPVLRHCGGDCMLGEALRHIYAKIVVFDAGVKINADGAGKHSGAKRRGFTEAPLAWNYTGEALSLDHQSFDTAWTTYHKGERTCGYMSSTCLVL